MKRKGTDMRIGVDYYPEHWDREQWSGDAQLMADTGVKLVRMAEFAWCRLEPSDGKFDFSWLDEAVRIFAEKGIDVVIGTPTNCPPRWLCDKHPEILPVGDSGRILPIGIRGHRCVNSPVFRRYADRIVRQLAEHYKDCKNVIAWQIDNELEANICYCEVCNEKHRRRLVGKYGSIDALNKAYGNVVWSGEYSSIEEIDPPYGGYNTAWLNPSYMLDFRRCAAEDINEFAGAQADIIRSVIPGAAVTTNTWFCYNTPDFYGLFDGLDFVSYDNYPTANIPRDSEEIYSHAFYLDMMRGIKQQSFWVMEQLSGSIGCWMPMKRTTRPGMLKGYALQAFAHGADTVVHFRWRTALFGAEMHWHGLIDHSGVPGRRFAEFAELCAQAGSLSDIRGTKLRSDIAILYSPDSEAAFRLQPQTDGYSYIEQLKLFHRAFTRYGVNVDVISEQADFSSYKAVCAPALYVTDRDTADRLYDFAEKGGTVILTARCGVKDKNNNCIPSPLPTVYAQLAGCHVSEYDPIGYDTAAVRTNDGEVYECKQWCDIIETDTAEVWAVYDSDFYKGKPAVTVNSFGRGRAYYIGTVGKNALCERLARTVLSDCGIGYTDGLPENVEVTTRSGGGVTASFIFNNSADEKSFTLRGEKICLKPFEMMIKRF